MSLADLSTKPTCKEVIAQCDKTIEAKNKAIELSNLALKSCSEQSGLAQTELNNSNEKLNAWYRNPFIVGFMGVLVGGLSYAILKK